MSASLNRPALIAMLVVVAGCGAGTAQSAATGRAVDSTGQYQLVFEMPRTDWHAGDSITGTATLSFTGSGGTDIATSGSGPIAFDFDQVGGTHHVVGLGTPDCRIGRLNAGQSISSPLGKSGVDYDRTDADFSRSFFADPLVHLPAGDWKITAVASLMQQSCGPPSDVLRASLLVHVTP